MPLPLSARLRVSDPFCPLQEQQEERKAATEGRMLSEECNTEVNSKAAEFNSKLQVRGAKTAD